MPLLAVTAEGAGPAVLAASMTCQGGGRRGGVVAGLGTWLLRAGVTGLIGGRAIVASGGCCKCCGCCVECKLEPNTDGCSFDSCSSERLRVGAPKSAVRREDATSGEEAPFDLEPSEVVNAGGTGANANSLPTRRCGEEGSTTGG